jgi:hypothetical protein
MMYANIAIHDTSSKFEGSYRIPVHPFHGREGRQITDFQGDKH